MFRSVAGPFGVVTDQAARHKRRKEGRRREEGQQKLLPPLPPEPQTPNAKDTPCCRLSKLLAVRLVAA